MTLSADYLERTGQGSEFYTQRSQRGLAATTEEAGSQLGMSVSRNHWWWLKEMAERPSGWGSFIL
jgi:hypothetical protein